MKGSYTPMFEHLKKFERILVAGPQRSGTHIAAKMIAADTGHEYVDDDIVWKNAAPLLHEFLKDAKGVVTPCPGMCRWLVSTAKIYKCFVVYMIRDMEDILKSQKRIKWPADGHEKELFADLPTAYRTHDTSAMIKRRFWDYFQKTALGPMAIQVNYESLEKHPLWVPKDRRVDFRPKQTSEDEERT